MAERTATPSEALVRGSFVPVPGAFHAAPAGIREAAKVELSFDAGAANGGTQHFTPSLSTDRLLIDFAAVDGSALDLDRAMRDCELVRRAITEHRVDVERLVAIFAGGRPLSSNDLAEASGILTKTGLTETQAIANGGGIIFLLLLAAAAVLAAGCESCAHTVASRKPPAAATK